MSLARSRWAAFGAAIAVTAGAGGIGLVQASGSGVESTVTPVAPCRLVDTRTPGTIGVRSTPLGAGQTMTVSAVGKSGDCDSVPTGATALNVNLTSVGATAESFVTAYPSDLGELPGVSHLNPSPSLEVSTNGIMVTLSDDGSFDVYNTAGSTHIVVDVLGFYAPGTSGASGGKGDTGPKGEVGETGAKGDIGPTGPQGETGPAGADGADGATGPAGADGADGATGPAGADGADGATGPAGADGADGATGPAGADGADGATGPAGADGVTSLTLLTPEAAGANCGEDGTRLDVGLDNGDGGGTAGDGTLQAGEIDDTAFLCKPPIVLQNSSFDDGLTGWITSGGVQAGTGQAEFDGHSGDALVAQDIDLTGVAAVSVMADWSDICCGGTLQIVVEPSGGGAALLTQVIATSGNGPATVDISSVANQPVRIKFVSVDQGFNDWHLSLTSLELVFP